MGFLGKALGVGFGFMLGGPLGALIGGFLGHMYDQEKEALLSQGLHCPRCGHTIPPGVNDRCPACGFELYQSQTIHNTEQRQFVFYVALASLAAKMAKADGRVTRDEINALDSFLRGELHIPPDDIQIIAQIFNQAKDSATSYQEFAQQFKQVVNGDRQVLIMMVHLLFRIALADGRFHPHEERFLQDVSRLFDLSEGEYQQIAALFIPQSHKAYQILGLSPSASVEEIKAAYKKLAREYHPDTLIAKGVPQEFVRIANEKMVEINNAYETIRKERGF